MQRTSKPNKTNDQSTSPRNLRPPIKMNTYRFFSFVILMALLGASGAAFHSYLKDAVAEAAAGLSIVLIIHAAAACLLTGLFWESLTRK
jgi:sulfite exporter TauE/SafE